MLKPRSLLSLSDQQKQHQETYADARVTAIDSVCQNLCDTVRAAPCVVLSAAPGADKTTRVPLALLDAGVVTGRILMLEPRRLAAIRAAQFYGAAACRKCWRNRGLSHTR